MKKEAGIKCSYTVAHLPKILNIFALFILCVKLKNDISWNDTAAAAQVSNFLEEKKIHFYCKAKINLIILKTRDLPNDLRHIFTFTI